ncbi:hypothetical protein BGZ94_001017 [Podila epigama]|nr:hypothetical protein BGZ94_001017 [Podila epigama]
MDSPSLAPQPHLPSSVYSPNPFPIDPTQPGGISRTNQFLATTTKKKDNDDLDRHDEDEANEVDIEVEETRGFMSGKEKKSKGGEYHHHHHGQQHHDHDQGEGDAYGYGLVTPVPQRQYHADTTMQKLGTGLKGAFAKTGLGGSSRDTDSSTPGHHEGGSKGLQHRHEHASNTGTTSAPTPIDFSVERGRPPGRTRAQSGGACMSGDSGSGSGHGVQDPFSDLSHTRRLQSLSPPPPPHATGQGQQWSKSDSNRKQTSNNDTNEQSRPFIGYQPPPLSPSAPARASGRYQPPRPLSQQSDLTSSDYEWQAGGGGGGGEGGVSGVRRQSALNLVTNAPSVHRTSSELDYDGDQRSTSQQRQYGRRTPTTDRLSRAKDWVANHSKNNSLSQQPSEFARERIDGRSSPLTPGAFPPPTAAARSNQHYYPQPYQHRHRLSMDSDDYALLTPPRGGYISGGGCKGCKGIQGIAILTMEGTGALNLKVAAAIVDGNATGKDIEAAVGPCDSPGGGFHGYPPGGPDAVEDEDDVDAESTIAPGSAIGKTGKKHQDQGQGSTEAKKAQRNKVEEENDPPQDEEVAIEVTPKVPNKRRLVLRLISLFSSLLVIVFLVAAAPVSKMSAPFESKAGLATHYIVAILSTIVSCAFVFNYFSRRLRRREKMKRYVLFGLDIFMSLAWMIDVFVCISKFPCAVGGQGGWCDMYNTSVFLAMVALVSFLAAFVWDIWGSFDHSKLIGDGPIMKPPPPGFYKNDKRVMANQGVQPGHGVPGMGMGMGMGMGRGGPMKGKNNKALW